ncbi:MAG: NF038143 family protein [Desulfobacteraceae bacterium]|jgi:hypothetical protein
MEKYNMILAAEEQFAREVTLGVIVTRPLTAWYYIIPGMFIIDFLRRGSAIRRYTKHFIYPRRLALEAARAISEKEDKSVITSHFEEDVSLWLNQLKLFSPELVQTHLKLIDVLVEHYSKLLDAEGDTHYLLIKHAYQNRENFTAFIDQLTAAEKAVDEKVIEKLGGDEKVKAKILAEQQQIEKRRQKMLDDIF